MQTNHLSTDEFAELLDSPDTQVLDTIDHGATRMLVATVNGLDVLIFHGHDLSATVVYPCHAFDAESAGSIHDHARACAANA